MFYVHYFVLASQLFSGDSLKSNPPLHNHNIYLLTVKYLDFMRKRCNTNPNRGQIGRASCRERV